MQFTEDQIIALAPDPASVKSGKDLAVSSKWMLKGASDKAIWGHCQGSGKNPYQTQIDLQNLAFKCSCPSRKFPCKHSLGLLLLYVRENKAFDGGTEPSWVAEWLDKRTNRIEKSTEQKNKPVNAESQAKRAEARTTKVSAGIEELQIWLKDLIRNGLIVAPEKPYQFWQDTAKRMIDAQAPGLANMVRELGNINYFEDNWRRTLLQKLLRIYLITESYKNLMDLPEDYREEVQSLVGFNQPKEEILKQQGINDSWLILSRVVEDDEQLLIEKNWLYGLNSHRFSLFLQFYPKSQFPETKLMPGTAMEATLAFYKGVGVYRALIKEQHRQVEFPTPEFFPNFTVALSNFSDSISSNPFLEKQPLLIANIRLIKLDNTVFWLDEEGKSLDAKMNLNKELKILAITGGRFFNGFFMMNENEAELLSIWLDQKYFFLNDL